MKISQFRAKGKKKIISLYFKDTQIKPMIRTYISGEIGGLNWKPMETLEKQLLFKQP